MQLLEYRICKEFGWTPAELDKQDAAVIDKFLTIMGLENQLRSAETKAIERNG